MQRKLLGILVLFAAGAAQAQLLDKSNGAAKGLTSSAPYFPQLAQAQKLRSTETLTTYLAQSTEVNSSVMLSVGSISVGNRIWKDTNGTCWLESSKLISLVNVQREPKYVKHQVPTIQVSLEPKPCDPLAEEAQANQEGESTVDVAHQTPVKDEAHILVSKLVVTNMKSDGSQEHCEGFVKPTSTSLPAICGLNIKAD